MSNLCHDLHLLKNAKTELDDGYSCMKQLFDQERQLSSATQAIVKAKETELEVKNDTINGLERDLQNLKTAIQDSCQKDFDRTLNVYKTHALEAEGDRDTLQA